jgi:hypothetical protein
VLNGWEYQDAPAAEGVADVDWSIGSKEPENVSAAAKGGADVDGYSASQAARLKLQPAQVEFARIRELYDSKLVSQSQYEAARRARDLAEAEFSGDTVAVSGAKLQFAQQEFLRAEGLFKERMISQADLEKARLAKEVAEARLSDDAAAIARVQVQIARHEFLRVEGLFKAGLSRQAEFEKAKVALDAAQAELSVTGSRTNSDYYSSVMGHVYVCGGKPFQDLEGLEQGWKFENVQPQSNGCLTNTGETAYLSTKTRFGKEDLTVNAALSLDHLNGSGAAFTFGDGYAFEFDRTDERFTVSGPTVLRSYQRGSAVGIITPGKRFVFRALRRESMFDFLVDQKLVLSVQFDRETGSVGFAPRKGTMRIYAFGASELYPHNAADAEVTRPGLQQAPVEFKMSGSQTNRDFYSGVTGHAYFCQGKPRAGLEGWEQGWNVEDGCLVNTGEVARISTKARFGKEDLVVSASLTIDELKGTGAAFTFALFRDCAVIFHWVG